MSHFMTDNHANSSAILIKCINSIHIKIDIGRIPVENKILFVVDEEECITSLAESFLTHLWVGQLASLP